AIYAYDATANLEGSESNTVNISTANITPSDTSTQEYIVRGLIDLSDAPAGSNNTVNITSGTIIRHDGNPANSIEASIIGSEYAVTKINISGGNTALIHNNSGGTIVEFNGRPAYGGQVYNFRNIDALGSGPYSRTFLMYDDITDKSDIYNYNGRFNYLAYSILNAGVINVGDGDPARPDPDDGSPRTTLTIGAITNMDHDNTYRAQDLEQNDPIPEKPNNFSPDPPYNGPPSGSVPPPPEPEIPALFYDDFYVSAGDSAGDGYQAQITAHTVNVVRNSKLTIHENIDRFGEGEPFYLSDDRRNVIVNLGIEGYPVESPCSDCGYDATQSRENLAVVTIDRTTIYTYDTHTLTLGEIKVGVNGILQGFGEITKIGTFGDPGDPIDRTPLRPNVLGNVLVKRGGKIRPFDAEIFIMNWVSVDDPGDPDYRSFEENDFYAGRLKGLTFKVDEIPGVPDSGITKFESASRLSTRLFADPDWDYDEDKVKNLYISGDGTDVGTVLPNGLTEVKRYLADSLNSYTLDFGQVQDYSIYEDADYYSREGWSGVKQSDKVQYDPVFGFANEIKSKLEFNIYQGDETGEMS
ncbi:MAG: hypothetical protein FWG74_06300, partial [Planctomycetes bacterium]|nr:hypothetical protein [Planctomycetota bacterium]